jgi:phage terminase large subunit-like protein
MRKPKPAEKANVKSDYPHVKAAERYVSGVISGKIPACKWVKLACERHRRDLKLSETSKFPYVFDKSKAERPCRFLEKLPHTKGKWAKPDPITRKRQTLILGDWQCFIVASIFGWVKKKTGKRRFRKARIYVPRKNGKSIFGAGIGIYMLVADNEAGAEIYSGATSQKQAMEVFKPAWIMCQNTPDILTRFGITLTGKTEPGGILLQDGSKFEPVIGKPGDGSSPHCAISDEFHEHNTADLIETMETGMGAREQPLSLVISTAGSNIAGPCREDWKACERILENTGGFEDDTTFAIIYTIDHDDKWDSEKSLIKANPNWGVSIEPEGILAELKVAKQSARKQSSFKTKYLNQWVTAKDGFYNVAEWEALANPLIKREDYKDFPSYIAGDLASKHDLVCLMQLFCLPDNRYAVFGKYYLPQATIEKPENQHYRNWKISGHLESAGDEITDLETFKEDAIELCRDYIVEEFPFDPNRAWGVFPALEREGLPVVEYRNTVMTMSEPMKELDALIRSGRIVHNGDPILAWAISNVTGKIDKKDNVYPNKENAANKIDPVVSTMFALGRAMTRDEGTASALFAW